MTGVDTLGGRPTLDADDRKALAATNDFGDFDFDLANLIMDWSVLDHEVTGVIGYQDSHKKSRTEVDRANSLQYTDTLAPSFRGSTTDVESWVYELRAAAMDNEFLELHGGSILPGPEHHHGVRCQWCTSPFRSRPGDQYRSASEYQ